MTAKEIHEKCLPDLLRGQASSQPDSTAVISEDASLTYGELVARCTDLASRIRSFGVAPDDCVGLFVEPSIDLMVGVWGILLAGGAYLPLSPEYPQERLRFMVEQSRATVFFTQDELGVRLKELTPPDATVITLNDVRPVRAEARSILPSIETELSPHHLAYVAYTSGSTGKPKGVMIEHRAIVNQMIWLHAAQRINRDKVVLQKTPMSFDAAQWEILSPGVGATVVVGGQGSYRDPARLIDLIVRHQVTTLQCVPTLLQALLETDEFHRCRSLTQIFCGGEALTKSLARACLDVMPGCELTNLYGPTECTINSSAFTVRRSIVEDGPHTIPIGKPVDGIEYYILDDHRVPVRTGEIGELYVGGVQLARGYLYRPDLTADTFIDHEYGRLYRTGDLASWNADGTTQFVGRADNQVNLRGFRVELDEIRLAIENHDWVRNAAVIVRDDPHTSSPTLIAFIELSPKEAALMDQGHQGAHHVSKANRLQIRAQLSNLGCREPAEVIDKVVVDLPGREATRRQRRQAFARKTYRFFEGGGISEADILRLLRRPPVAKGLAARRVDELSLEDWGGLLRSFGPFHSADRLLPKYAYASPGSLYATQMYLELDNICGLPSGYYYHHPVAHQLILIRERTSAVEARVKVHFVGKRRAIEPVYRNNIQEVMEIEAGHMIGLFDEILPGHGLCIKDLDYLPGTTDHLECADDDHYLGTFEIVTHVDATWEAPLDIYVQPHEGRVEGMPAGQYLFRDGRLERISVDLILRRHVIAINQQVYERSSLGITVVSRNPRDWLRYMDLGRMLQRLQMNDLNLGFMSSGYSSRTGNALPSAKRTDDVLRAAGLDRGPSYFFVGGRVSDEQWRSEGMKEDAVHMKGPTEMIRDDLVNYLPDYMMPNRVIVLDRLPLTATGKVDLRALDALAAAEPVHRRFVAPRTVTEKRLCEIWAVQTKRAGVSVRDDFFESGGNSLVAVALINRINRVFACSLPLQVLFEAPTVEQLAKRIDDKGAAVDTRLVCLRAGGGQRSPVYCWPGLGGYPMNLRALSARAVRDRPFYGVQAFGINAGEEPYGTVAEMAAEDVRVIKRLQPVGPYTLWGYSFGAKVAFEVAYQLEQAGDRVADLVLIAPGSPRVGPPSTADSVSAYSNRAFVTILFSVFAGGIADPRLAECLTVATDEDSFVAFVGDRFEGLDPDLVRRIVGVVHRTYAVTYSYDELARRRVHAPITVLEARGDSASFLEHAPWYPPGSARVVRLEADHYGVLGDPDLGELVRKIRKTPRRTSMPHVNIKHFPASLSDEQQSELVAAVTTAVKNAFKCDESVISIALEPVEQDAWNEHVYVPEIVNRKYLLRKMPDY